MNSNTLYNVSDPVNPRDVATKEYADNNRSHIIAIMLVTLVLQMRINFNLPSEVTNFTI